MKEENTVSDQSSASNDLAGAGKAEGCCFGGTGPLREGFFFF